MTTTAHAPAVGRLAPGVVAVRLVAAAALGASAYLHITLAEGPLAADGQVTVAGLFVAQAVVATAAALWVLLRGGRLAWAVAGVVGLGSLLALLASLYVDVPAFGPFPSIYEPGWYSDKAYAAVTAGVAAAVAAGALLAPRERRL